MRPDSGIVNTLVICDKAGLRMYINTSTCHLLSHTCLNRDTLVSVKAYTNTVHCYKTIGYNTFLHITLYRIKPQ